MMNKEEALPLQKVVDEWYKEERNYNYRTGMPKAPGLQIKHFAQVK